MTELLVPEGRWTAERRDEEAAERSRLHAVRILFTALAAHGLIQSIESMRGTSRGVANHLELRLSPEAHAAAERWILTGECDPS